MSHFAAIPVGGLPQRDRWKNPCIFEDTQPLITGKIMPRVGDTAKLHSSERVVCITKAERNTELVDCFYWVSEGDNAGPAFIEGIHESCLTNFDQLPRLRKPIYAGSRVALRGYDAGPFLYANEEARSLFDSLNAIWLTDEGELVPVSIPAVALEAFEDEHA